MERETGLPPIVDENSRTLILGTLPGAISRQQQQYYSHGGNAFWRILAGVCGEAVGDDYDCRVEFLRRRGIAVWDVLSQAVIEGSSDASISEPVANDFEGLFANHPSLRTVAFNGSKASDLFARLVRIDGQHFRLGTLVSSSSARAVPLAEKVASWRSFLVDGAAG